MVISNAYADVNLGRYDEACASLEDAKAVINDNTSLNNVFSNIQTIRKDKYITEIESYIIFYEYEFALKTLSNALSSLPCSEPLRTEYAKLYTDYVYLISDTVLNDINGSVFENNDLYISAIDITALAKTILPDDEKLKANSAEANKRYITDSISEIEALINANNYRYALLIYSKVTEVFPNEKQLKALYESGVTKYESYLTETVNTLTADGKFEDAFGLINDTFEYLPNNETAKSLNNTVYDKYVTHIVGKAQEYVNVGDALVAINLLSNAIKKYPTEEKFNTEYDKIYSKYTASIRNTANTEANGYIASGDYINAIKTIESAIQKLSSDEELEARLEAYKKQYADNVISAANAQYERYNATSIFTAEDMLFEALKIIPDYASLKEAYAKYEALEPTKVEMELWQYANLVSPQTDNMGKIYYYVFSVAQYWDVEVNIDYQYTILTGCFFQSDRYKNATTSTTLNITTDQTSWTNSVSGKSEPKYFTLNVSNCKAFSIELICTECDPGNYCPHAYVGDLYLWDY